MRRYLSLDADWLQLISKCLCLCSDFLTDVFVTPRCVLPSTEIRLGYRQGLCVSALVHQSVAFSDARRTVAFPHPVTFDRDDFGRAPHLLKYVVLDLAQFVTRDHGKLSKVGGLDFLLPEIPYSPFLKHFRQLLFNTRWKILTCLKLKQELCGTHVFISSQRRIQ